VTTRWWFVMVGGSARDVVVWGPFDTREHADESAQQEVPAYRTGHPGYYTTTAVPTRVEAEGRAAYARRELREAGYK
jgi:hypothetical protein